MTVVPYVVGAVAAGIGGGLLATWWAPSRWVTSYIQHFAAGVVIAAVALKVAPDMEHTGAPPLLVMGGFALGGLVMIGVKWVTLRIEERQQRKRGKPWGLAAAAAVDTAIDGLIIGTGFALGRGVGVILSLALGLELLFLTLSVGASFGQHRGSRGTTIAVTSGISLLLLVGALGGMALLRGASTTAQAVLLAFGAAALLYLVTEELLVETHLQQETLLSTAMFFLGFLAIFAFVSLGPDWGPDDRRRRRGEAAARAYSSSAASSVFRLVGGPRLRAHGVAQQEDRDAERHDGAREQAPLEHHLSEGRLADLHLWPPR